MERSRAGIWRFCARSGRSRRTSTRRNFSTFPCCRRDDERGRRSMKRASSLLVIAAFLSWAPALEAQGGRQIKVVVNFTQSGTQGERALGASGGVVVTRRGGRPDGRFAAAERPATLQRSAGVFTLVQDGRTSSLPVATKVPYTAVASSPD